SLDPHDRAGCPQYGYSARIRSMLNEIQQSLFDRALAYRQAHTTKVDSYDEFQAVLDDQGGFVLAHWDGTDETEARIKEETKATIRCIPLPDEAEALGADDPGEDMLTGKPSAQRVVFARAY